MNLATKIAWLEGFSVHSECTGEQYCKVIGPDSKPLKYDPIGRPAILVNLLQKYKVDLDWLTEGGCDAKIYGSNEQGKYLAIESLKDHNGCFSTTVLAVILGAQKC